jgi:hypothetical protein
VTRESSFLDAATREQEGQIDFSSSQLRLSSDGTVLAAAANNEDFQYVTDRKVKVFALPSGALPGAAGNTLLPNRRHQQHLLAKAEPDHLSGGWANLVVEPEHLAIPRSRCSHRNSRRIRLG